MRVELMDSTPRQRRAVDKVPGPQCRVVPSCMFMIVYSMLIYNVNAFYSLREPFLIATTFADKCSHLDEPRGFQGSLRSH